VDQLRQIARVVNNDNVVAARHEQNRIHGVGEVNGKLVAYDRMEDPARRINRNIILHLTHSLSLNSTCQRRTARDI
jgi:hypothetical protein